ncbi:3'-5' exonuclease [Coniosporium apollinis]|uniref:RNA exonuclease 4 n=1 Tax=Coniosporium apollinis TaxID=61459 RepID=A0ABQ9NNP4_9PEZI|nr:3'-5' exonuclease [Coniosporium apollinis]
MAQKTLSSNWKKLQATLQKEQPQSARSNTLKRKSANEQPAPQQNGHKSTRPTKHEAPPHKRRKMGSTASQPASASVPPSATLALFAEDHDIPAADLAAAYNIPLNSTTLPTQSPADTPNAGRSATATLGKYIALDCEMVGTGPPPALDSQLARVSLVNYHGHQLYDSYVLPTIPITDYRTAVSGITPALLRKGYARPFAEVQRDVAELISGRILVGHALKNDLGVLVLSHPRRDIRDTARHPKFRALSMGKAPSLKRLASEVLGVEIQGGQHSSIEDARATMALFREEKEAFEEEHLKRWGRPKAVEEAVDGGEADNGTGQGRNNKKRKKKGKR